MWNKIPSFRRCGKSTRLLNVKFLRPVSVEWALVVCKGTQFSAKDVTLNKRLCECVHVCGTRKKIIKIKYAVAVF